MAHASQRENIPFLKMPLEVFDEFFGTEEFSLWHDPSSRRACQDDLFSGLRQKRATPAPPRPGGPGAPSDDDTAAATAVSLTRERAWSRHVELERRRRMRRLPKSSPSAQADAEVERYRAEVYGAGRFVVVASGAIEAT